MKLKRFLLRYYPPGENFPIRPSLLCSCFLVVCFSCTLGIILEYELRDHSREMKEIDLLHLTPEYVIFPNFQFFYLMLFFCSADIDVIVNQIVFEEPLISDSKKPHLRKLLYSTFYFLVEQFSFTHLISLLFSRIN
jgi:dynein assembly factor with WDR repeat domains 1